jgi:hypothetical protein
MTEQSATVNREARLELLARLDDDQLDQLIAFMDGLDKGKSLTQQLNQKLVVEVEATVAAAKEAEVLPDDIVNKAHLQDQLTTSERFAMKIIGELAISTPMTRKVLFGYDGLEEMVTTIARAIDSSAYWIGGEQLVNALK